MVLITDRCYVAFQCDTVSTGKGIFEWSNGAIYSGDWAWNRRHGYGVYTELCARTCQLIQYNGQWCCDRRQVRAADTTFTHRDDLEARHKASQ